MTNTALPPHSTHGVYSDQPLVPCSRCPGCGLNTGTFCAANGRGGALHRCVHCGARYDGAFPGEARRDSRSRCIVCHRPIPYQGRGRPPKRCRPCKGDA